LESCPYLLEKFKFVRWAIEQGKYVLGVCLGAQIISEVLGGKTEPSPQPEVGFFPITLTQAGKNDPLFIDFPDSFIVGHWHKDMLGLPEGARVLAQSDGCPRQIVRYSDRVLGLQCHMEMTPYVVNGFVDRSYSNFPADTYVQRPEDMFSIDFHALAEKMHKVLDGFLQ
jgi:GMP synthase (glutamine-hydrolysing)